MQPSDLHRGHSAIATRERSLAWEMRTGADSIPTIERVYDQTPSGAYVCIWPGCSFARRNAAALWHHVHSAHGDSLPPADFTEREPEYE